jgi:hypothetical protein
VADGRATGGTVIKCDGAAHLWHGTTIVDVKVTVEIEFVTTQGERPEVLGQTVTRQYVVVV